MTLLSEFGPPPDQMTLLTIDGQRYGGWLDMSVGRSIDRMASEFSIAVSERWNSFAPPWQIHKFDACTVLIGDDAVLTGYVDSYNPSIDATSHAVRIGGRSRTCDLIDCMPDVPSGQYRGYRLPAIARALAQPFGIEVVVDVQGLEQGEPFADVMIDRNETAFEFLERLARLSAVLLTDDERGRLVLTRTGSARAHDALVLGVNVLRASATLNGARQFSRYVVKGQRALQRFDSQGEQEQVQTGQEASATDPSVPRFRQHVSYAESMLTPAQMQARVRWQAIYAAGRATQAAVSVRGWRQSDGSLWKLNTLVCTTIPALELDQDMLIAGVRFAVGPQGHVTELALGPPEAYTPDPGQVRLRKRRGRHGGGDTWAGADGIEPGAPGGGGSE